MTKRAHRLVAAMAAAALGGCASTHPEPAPAPPAPPPTVTVYATGGSNVFMGTATDVRIGAETHTHQELRDEPPPPQTRLTNEATRPGVGRGG